jgi:FMN phosphatase YigB (HAD superfamily)
MASMNYAKVRAVSFDVDDTLVYRTASRRTYYKRVLDSAGLRFSESTIQKATRALFEWERENFDALDGSNTVKIRTLFSTLLQELGVRGDKALT